MDRLASHPAGQRLRGLRDPMEFVNEAIGLLLKETERPGTGRRVHPRHLQDMASFFNFAQSVVQSCINNQFKQLLRQGEHVPINSPELSTNVEPAAPTDIVRDVVLKETTREMVNDLKQQFKHERDIHAAVVDFEENGLDANRLPKAQQTDKQMHRLRTKAREVLKEMSAREGISCPTGKEMFSP